MAFTYPKFRFTYNAFEDKADVQEIFVTAAKAICGKNYIVDQEVVLLLLIFFFEFDLNENIIWKMKPKGLQVLLKSFKPFKAF